MNEESTNAELVRHALLMWKRELKIPQESSEVARVAMAAFAGRLKDLAEDIRVGRLVLQEPSNG